MNTEIMKNENKQLAVNTNTSDILSSDVVIPRLLLMQGMSDLVKTRKAQAGDIVRSVDAYKMGSPDATFEFIPLSTPIPSWIIERKLEGNNRFTYFSREKRTAKNEMAPWQYTADMDGNEGKGNIQYRRIKCLSLYVLLPQDIDAFMVEKKKAENGEMPDLSKALTPLLVEFRSTGFRAGKEITTYYTQASQFGTNPSYYKLKLGCAMESSDDNDYYVFTVDRAKPTPITKEQKSYVDYWTGIVNAGNVKVDDTSDTTENTVNSEEVPF